MTSSAPPTPGLGAILRPVAIASAAMAVVFVGGFSAWGLYAPLSSAAIAPGVVSPESSRKTIQHLEGGIVQELAVSDGDRVAAGDLLIRLSPAQAWAGFSARQRQWYRLEAERLRLEALEEELESLIFPVDLEENSNADYRSFLRNQQAQFATQRQGLAQREAILKRRLRQLEKEVAAIERENDGLAEQLEILSEEIADKELLIARNLVRKPDLLALRRLRAEIRSLIAANEATIARAAQRAEEIELSILSVKTDFQEGLAKDVTRVNSELAQLEEAMASSEDVLLRTSIHAPVSGTVLNLRARTIGGTVLPGEPILDIVPDEDALVIEARLAPTDVNVVAVGQPARVHLTPYAARHVAPLDGQLVHISPDAIFDEATRESHYEVRIKVDPDNLGFLAADVELTPGMPAEVYIVTGEQTMVNYLTAPFTRSFRRAFREE